MQTSLSLEINLETEHVLVHMRWIAIVFAFLTTGLSSVYSLETSVSPEIGVSEALLVSQDTRYDPKLQLQSAAEARVRITVGPVSLAGSVGLHHAFPSSIAGGYLYRGFRGWHGGGSIELERTLRQGSDGNSVVGALAARGTARFSRYLNTDLIFFYPQVGISPSLRMKSSKSPNFYSISLPIDIYFRRDFSYSVSLGLAVSFGTDLIEVLRQFAEDEEYGQQ